MKSSRIQKKMQNIETLFSKISEIHIINWRTGIITIIPISKIHPQYWNFPFCSGILSRNESCCKRLPIVFQWLFIPFLSDTISQNQSPLPPLSGGAIPPKSQGTPSISPYKGESQAPNFKRQISNIQLLCTLSSNSSSQPESSTGYRDLGISMG